MAIIQISKIQQRSGNLVDLPQLDDAQFGWASDEKKLFIGKTLPNENIEVLTSYSNIEFSQLVGSEGNLNITAAANGEVLAYDGINWVNKGAAAGGLINLGTVGNVKIGGGATGYVLETDGTGNLAWTPKATIIAYISNVTKASPAVVTTVVPNFLSDNAKVTVTDVGGMTQLNGNSYYINVLTSSTFSLYADAGLTVPIDSTGYGTYTSGGRVVCTPGASGGSSAGGANTTVQFNNNNLLDGDPDFTYDYNTNLLSLTGNANVGNLNATSLVTASRLVSNIATGTAPFTVTSTTQVANLNVATAGLATYATTANSVAGANVSGAVAYATTANSVAASNVSGAVAYATTANSVAGSNVSGAVGLATYATTANSVAGANVSGTVANATYATSAGSAGTAGTVTTNAQPNITSTGTLTSVSVTGNATTGGIITDNYYYANGVSISFAGSYSNSNVAAYLPTYTGTVGATSLIATGNSNIGSGTTTAAGLQFIPGYASGYFGMFGTGVTPNNTNYSIIVKNDGSVLNLNTTVSIVSKVNNGSITTLDVNGLSVVAGKTFYATEISTSANTTVGNLTGNWQLTAGSTLNATYADLAEYYEADQNYDSATVLEFGGDKEVTLATDGTTRVAGVVSTNPAYAMNANCKGIAVAVALQGRVPTKVRGKVSKGDMMVSAGEGYARPSVSPQIGTVIGKALENFDGIEGVIEVAVGRL